MFSSTGSSVFSYSSLDSTVRLWETESGFAWSCIVPRTSQLARLEPTPGQERSQLLQRVGGRSQVFVEGGLKLVREDLKEYEINLSLV